MIKTLINGQAQTGIAVSDRGLHYGDGLFETIAVRVGVPQRWHRHWRRLSRGCERLGITGIDEKILQEEARQVCVDMDLGVLKLMVTRGSGGRGYRPDRHYHATRILASYAWPDYPAAHRREGVSVRVCATRLGRNPALAGLKHLNRLEQVMARREWDTEEIAEGLMLDDRQQVISGTMSNLFMVRGGCLLTPRLDECGVEGVMRGTILDLASELRISAEETALTLHDLGQAEELFLCNALIEIWPVRRVEHQAYDIGPVTRRLSERLKSSRDSADVKAD